MTDQEKQQFFKNMKTFLALAKNELGIEKLPKIIWILDSDNTGQTSFGGFVLKTQAIRIVLKNRHPNDIMRTLAHELVHYKQWTENRLDATSGDDGSAEENEANAKAGVIMRQFNRDNPDSFSMKALSEGSKMVQAIDHKSLDSIYGIQAFNRDKTALKKKQTAIKDKEARTARSLANQERRQLSNEPDSIALYHLVIPTSAIHHWRETKDAAWALNFAKTWGGAKLSWPKEVLNDLYSNTEWQNTVLRLWALADLILMSRGSKHYVKPSRLTGRQSLAKVGEDPEEVLQLFHKLTGIVKDTLAKHNIDKTGRRLPSR